MDGNTRWGMLLETVCRLYCQLPGILTIYDTVETGLNTTNRTRILFSCTHRVSLTITVTALLYLLEAGEDDPVFSPPPAVASKCKSVPASSNNNKNDRKHSSQQVCYFCRAILIKLNRFGNTKTC